MKINQVNKILQDKNMQNKNCNFKITNSNGGRKPGSKNKMTLAKLAITVNDLAIEMRKGFAQINSRIDNLVIKNDLKE